VVAVNHAVLLALFSLKVTRTLYAFYLRLWGVTLQLAFFFVLLCTVDCFFLHNTWMRRDFIGSAEYIIK